MAGEHVNGQQTLGENIAGEFIFTRLALFLATVATNSAVFVATLPVSQIFWSSLLFYFEIWNWLKRKTSSLRSVQDLVQFVASSNRLPWGIFYRITTMFG